MGKPELRFPEFTEEWEEVILNDVLKRVSKPVDVEKETLYRQIGIRSHGKGLFYKEDVTGKELGNKRVFWIEPDCLVLNIVFAWERAVARTTKNEVGMIASHRFPMYKTADNKLDLDYAVQYLTTKRGSNILILASPGGAGRNKTLGQDAFLKSRMLLPNIAEQKRIVELLKAINDVIAVAQKQVSLWEEKKKCAMQRIFSQEIRFKADDGSDYPEWEKKKIGDILTICHGRDYKDCENEDGKYPVLGTGGIIAMADNYLCDWECVLIGRKGTIDKPQYMNTPFWCVDTLFYSKPYENELPKYQYYLFQNINWKKYNEASGVPSLSASTIERIEIKSPCKEEQEKIAICLSALDDAINIKRKKVEVWENIREGLLQQMFI